MIGSLPSYNTTPDESLVGPDPTILPTTPLGHDTDDAYGEVFLDYMRRTSETDPLIEAQNFESTYHTLNTWHAPLVVSAGPDGDFGMYGPHEGWYGRLGQPKANATGDAYATALQDNVTNLNGQASGTGGQ